MAQTLTRKEFSEFLDYLSTRVSKGTMNTYTDSIIRWIRFVGNSSDNGHLNESSAQKYLDSMVKAGKAPNTVAVTGHAIRKFLKWRGADSVKLDMPPVKISEPKYKTIHEVNKVLSACKTPLETALVTLLFDTGARISEVLNLKMGDIDWEAGMITVTRKGGRRDDININDKSVEVLREWLKSRKFSSDRVFGELDYYTAWRLVKTIGRRAGIELNPHVFRHSRAVHLLKNKTPINVVSQHLGHRNIMTTINIYGRFTAGDLKEHLAEW